MRRFLPTIVCDDLAAVPGFASLLRGQYVRVGGTLGRVLGTVDGVPYWTSAVAPQGFRGAVLAFRMMVARRIVRAAVLGPVLPGDRIMPAIEQPGSCLAFALFLYIVLGLAFAIAATFTRRHGVALSAFAVWGVGLATYYRGVWHAPQPEEAEA